MSRFLLDAAKKGDANKVRELLDKGADIHWGHKATGRTALIEAAINGHLEVARLLVERGADLNGCDTAMGFTPLGWACDHPALVEFFLNAGADPNLATPEFLVTPLMAASQNGNVSVVKLLLEARADVNAATCDGRTALKIAQAKKRAEVIRLLENAGATADSPLPKPERIPWPDVDQTGLMGDDSQPETVLRGFILAMNRFEKEAHALTKRKGATVAVNEEIRNAMRKVFDVYCTPTERPHGRQGSFQIPPEYDPDGEFLIAINHVSPRKAELITRDKTDANEFLYIAIKQQDRWRLDKKKRRTVGAKWKEWSL